MSTEQDCLFDVAPDWAEKWQGMPEFQQDDVKPFDTINVQFKNEEDRRQFLIMILEVSESGKRVLQ